MRGVLVAIALCLVACDRGDAIELGEWTLQYEGQERQVETPGFLPLPDHAVAWTLEREVEIPEAWRGRPMTLTIPVYLGPALFLHVDGIEAVSVDDSGMGFAFRVPASPAPRRTLAITGHHMIALDANLRSAPRLSPTTNGDTQYRTVTTFHEWTVYGTLGALAMVAILYGSAWLMERKRLYLWFGIQTLAGAWTIGMYYTSHDRPWALIMAFVPLSTSLAVAAGAAFNHAHFARGPVPRVIVATVPACACLTVIGVIWPFSTRWFQLSQIVLFGGIAYNFWFLAREMRTRAHASDARVFASAWALLLVASGFDGAAATGVVIVPFAAFPVTVAAYAALQSYVVARERARRVKEVEGLNVELRRQVADRSRELADALSGSTVSNAPIGAGTVVEDRYKVVRKLGAGAMGAVYEVERISDGRRCALKVITMRATGDVLARFAREAQLAATLDAPNLVAVIDVGVSRTLGLFLVMELVGGGSLEQQRARFGDEAWARPLCRQIAAGVAVMHAADVLHRDLKPANVMLTGGEPPVVKIADFGLAGVFRAPIDVEGDTAAPQLTQLGAFLGTPAYMAPELARGAEHASPASDVFALGVVAHDLLTGKAPFADAAVLLAQRGARLPVVDGVPDVIARALDADPARRPTAAELRDAL